MQMTDGVAHLRGSSPKSPTPRVTTSRMYASSSPLFATASSTSRCSAGFASGISSQIPLAEAYNRSRCCASRNTRRLYTRIPSKTPSPYSSPWSNTDTLALVRSWYVPSIQTMGGIDPLARVGDDLVEHGAGEVLVPSDGAALHHHLHAGRVVPVHFQRDADLAVTGCALDFPLFSVAPLLDLGFRLPDLELVKCLAGGGRRTLNGDGDDGLDPALGQVDTATRASTRGGDHAAGEQQRRGAASRRGPQGGARSSHPRKPPKPASRLPHRILREYTWLTDPPATVPQAGAPVTQITDFAAQNGKTHTQWNRYSAGLACGLR